MSITDASSVFLNERELRSLEIGGFLVWEASSLTIRSCAVGSEVYIEETAGALVPYIVIAHGHHGDNLSTLIRKHASSTNTRFHFSAPTQDFANKFDGSTLELTHTQMFDDMPTATQEKIAQVAVPTRSSAMGNYTIDGVAARLFPLSEMEFSGGGVAEGSHIPYFDSNAKRVAYSDTGTARATWTRTITGGMPNYARQVSTSGSIGNQLATSSVYIRPALCLPFDTKVTEVGGKLQI